MEQKSNYFFQTEITIEEGKLIRYVSGDTDITVPAQVREIGDRAFFCPWMETIRIPDSVKALGKSPFHDCNRLKSVHIPAHLLEGMTWNDAVRLFTDERVNYPSTEWWYLHQILDGTADFSEAFYALCLKRLTEPFHKMRWLYKSIGEDRPRWVMKLLELNDSLTEAELEKCIARATQEGMAEIAAILINHKCSCYPPQGPDWELESEEYL